jgi:K+-transporting ATPase KdpF subunit
MTFMELVGLVLSVAVGIYLFVALLYPEKFERLLRVGCRSRSTERYSSHS